MNHQSVRTVAELENLGQANIQTGPFGTQLKASEYVNEGIPVINVRNIGIGKVKKENLEYISQAKAEKLHHHYLHEGDIVFGRKGAVERHALIDDSTEGWIQGSDCLRLRVSSRDVYRRFLSYFFRTKAHQDWMQALCSFGATMSSLNQDIVRRICFPDLPITVQKKIAAVLSAYDDLIENSKRRIALLEKMAEEIYREWFVRFRFPGHEKVKFVKGVPEGWNYVKINDLCSIIKRGISPSYDDTFKRLVVNQRCIRDGCIDLNVARRHNTSIPREKLIRYGDALINSTGVGTLGRISIVEFDPEDLTTDSHVTICRANIGKIGFHYFAHTIKRLQEYFEYMATRATGQVELNRDLIAGTKILVPETAFQCQFAEIVDSIWRKKQSLSGAINKLKAMRDLLLPRLISGKLSVENLDIHFPPSMLEDAEIQDTAYA